MRSIKLTQGKVAIVDDRDYEYLNQWKWCFNGFYAARRKGRHIVKMHRVIMGRLGLIPEHVDHINGDRLDNRRCNLRLATNVQNCMNRGPQRNNTSGYKGVSYNYKKWKAEIKVDGKKRYLGQHDTKEQAALAYNNAALELHGEFARLNLIPPLTD